MIEVMFEKYGFDSAYIAIQVLILHFFVTDALGNKLNRVCNFFHIDHLFATKVGSYRTIIAFITNI
jgi:hypothetical protein